MIHVTHISKWLISMIAICFTVGVYQIESVVANSPHTNISQEHPDETDKEGLLERVRDRGSVRVWVHYDMEFTREGKLSEAEVQVQRSEVASMHQTLKSELNRRELPFNEASEKEYAPAMVLTVREETLKFLFDSDLIEKVREVRILRSHVQESTETIEADRVWNSIGLDGDGEAIVIIDTGVDYEHEMFQDKVVEGACFSTEDPWEDTRSICKSNFGIEAGGPCEGNFDDLSDECAHGTHVASIANEVAKGAEILSVQVFTKFENDEDCPDGDAPCIGIIDEDLADALNWVDSQRHSYDLASVILSLGDGVEHSNTCDNLNSTMTDLVNNLYGIGSNVLTVASAGNENFDNGLEFPACIDNVFAVGATDNQDIRWDEDDTTGSNVSNMLDLVAPGVNIQGAVPGGGYAQMTGTSMAAPHVAGTVALMKEAVAPSTLQASEAENELTNSADWESHMGWTPPSDDYGYGRLNSYEAVLEAFWYNPISMVYDQDVTIQNHTYEGRDIYVLEGTTLTIGGEVNLDLDEYDRPTNLNVGGTIESGPNAILNIIKDSQYNLLPTGIDNFDGTIVSTVGGENVEYVLEDTKIDDGSKLHILAGTEVYVSGTNIVEKNAALKVEEGVHFKMDEGAELTADGTVTMEGSESYPIKFDRLNSSESWNGITLNGDDNHLEYVEINGAGTHQALRVSGSKGTTISHCTIENSSNWGLWIDDVTTTTVSNSLIQNNGHGGMVLMNLPSSSTYDNINKFEYNTVTDNGHSSAEEGVYVWNSTVQHFYRNVIENNQGNGISIMGASDVNFRLFTEGLSEGYNRIKDNDAHQVYVTNLGNALIGGTGSNSGYNTITGLQQPNSNSQYVYNLTLSGPQYGSSVTTYAWFTFWGSYFDAFPSDDYFTGNVDYSNHLSSDPTGSSGSPLGGSTAKIAGNEQGTRMLMSASMVETLSEGQSDQSQPLSLAERVFELRDVLANKPGDRQSAKRLRELHYLRQSDRSDEVGLHRYIDETNESFINKFENIATEFDEQQAEFVRFASEMAMTLDARLELIEGNSQQAVDLISEYARLIGDTGNRVALKELLAGATAQQKDYKSGSKLVAGLIKTEPDDEVAGWYDEPNYKPVEQYFAINEGGGGNITLPEYNYGVSQKQLTSAEKEPIPDEFGLEANYPNPFNPATTIPFTLPESADVTVEVYNTVGQRIGTLATGEYEAGSHQVDFDGSRLASGVYLIRVVMQESDGGNNHEFTRQVTLVK